MSSMLTRYITVLLQVDDQPKKLLRDLALTSTDDLFASLSLHTSIPAEKLRTTYSPHPTTIKGSTSVPQAIATTSYFDTRTKAFEPLTDDSWPFIHTKKQIEIRIAVEKIVEPTAVRQPVDPAVLAARRLGKLREKPSSESATVRLHDIFTGAPSVASIVSSSSSRGGGDGGSGGGVVTQQELLAIANQFRTNIVETVRNFLLAPLKSGALSKQELIAICTNVAEEFMRDRRVRREELQNISLEIRRGTSISIMNLLSAVDMERVNELAERAMNPGAFTTPTPAERARRRSTSPTQGAGERPHVELSQQPRPLARRIGVEEPLPPPDAAPKISPAQSFIFHKTEDIDPDLVIRKPPSSVTAAPLQPSPRGSVVLPLSETSKELRDALYAPSQSPLPDASAQHIKTILSTPLDDSRGFYEAAPSPRFQPQMSKSKRNQAHSTKISEGVYPRADGGVDVLPVVMRAPDDVGNSIPLSSTFLAVTYTVSGVFPRPPPPTATDRIGEGFLRVSLMSQDVIGPDEDILITAHVLTKSPVRLTWWLAYGEHRMVLDMDALYSKRLVTTFQVSETAVLLTIRRGCLVPGWEYHIHLTASSDVVGTTASSQTNFLLKKAKDYAVMQAIAATSQPVQQRADNGNGMTSRQHLGYARGYHGDEDRTDPSYISPFSPQNGQTKERGGRRGSNGAFVSLQQHFDEMAEVSKQRRESVPDSLVVSNLSTPNQSPTSKPLDLSDVNKRLLEASPSPARGAQQGLTGISLLSPVENVRTITSPEAAHSAAATILAAQLGSAGALFLTPGSRLYGPNQSFQLPAPSANVPIQSARRIGMTYHEQLQHFFLDEVQPLFQLSVRPNIAPEEFQAILKNVAQQFWHERQSDAELDVTMRRRIVEQIKAEIMKKGITSQRHVATEVIPLSLRPQFATLTRR